MKKFTILVALILCVTIGSVYATWFYAETDMQPAEHRFKNLGITDVNTSAQTGRISVTDTLILKIDDNSGDHRPGWDTDVNDSNGGEILIRFDPNSGAPDSEFTCTFSISNNLYKGQPIFEFTGIDLSKLADKQEISQTTFTYKIDGTGNRTKEVFESGAQSIEKSNLVGAAEKIISLNSIINRLQVNSDIELKTFAEYEEYKEALEAVVLTLTIEEVSSTNTGS